MIRSPDDPIAGKWPDRQRAEEARGQIDQEFFPCSAPLTLP